MSSGGTLARRRICVSSNCPVAGPIRALAAAQGHDVVDFEDEAAVDLMVVDGVNVHPLSVAKEGARQPILVVTPRRLTREQRADLIRGGAARVLDRDASVLDLAFAFSDLLFETRIAQRRYAKLTGGIPVDVEVLDNGRRCSGRLVSIARFGGVLTTEQPLADGTRIELRFTLDGTPIALLGRVAYTADEHVGLEFALDDVQVAPKLRALSSDWAEVSSLGTATV